MDFIYNYQYKIKNSREQQKIELNKMLSQIFVHERIEKRFITKISCFSQGQKQFIQKNNFNIPIDVIEAPQLDDLIDIL